MSKKESLEEEIIYYLQSHNIRSIPNVKWLRLIVIEILEKFITPLPNEKLIEELETIIRNYINHKLDQNLSPIKEEE